MEHIKAPEVVKGGYGRVFLNFLKEIFLMVYHRYGVYI